MGNVQEDLATVVRGLVDEPDEVSVEEFDGAESSVLELRVAEADLGKVIGRQGRVVRALRTLLRARGDKDRRVYELEILED